ncbi:arginase family protein [Candidatus Pacearchaeota archaeon]|nr:arginase family protein [Candidatus Pacearchaeota archaeon]
MKILKIPFVNGLNKTSGCEKSPDKILDVLDKEIYSNSSLKSIDFKLLDISEIKNNNDLDISNANKIIYDESFEFFKNSGRIFFLGGDHSISYSTTRAFFDYCQSYEDKTGKIKEPCLIIFDAHPDLMPFAFPFKKDEIPTHEEWLRKLVDDGFPVENILLIGNRNSDFEELKFISDKKIKTASIDYFLENIEESCDWIMEFASGKELYVSIDIDVIDPIFAPATGYREVGGFSSREFLYLVKRISKMKNLKGIDLVEINPEKDRDNLTVKLGAKILSEFL